MTVSVSTFYLQALRRLPGMGPVTILGFLSGELTLPNALDHEAVFTQLKAIERFTTKKRIKSALETLTLDGWLSLCSEVQNHLDAVARANVGILGYFDEAFPERLRHCPATTEGQTGKEDPPLWLYYQGNLDCLQAPALAVIGSREPTENGQKAATFFASRFAESGFNIVSGLAAGCDAAAHRGALAVNGLTTAFLAFGHNHPLDAELAQAILAGNGLLLSEYPPHVQNEPYMFVKRDRLQAGLAHATLVIQTKVDGGTMHAVHATQNARKPLYVVVYRQSADLASPTVAGNQLLLDAGYAQPMGSNSVDFTVDELLVRLRNDATTR